MTCPFPDIIPAEYVRWYYKPIKWDDTYFSTELFSGYDMIRIENQYRKYCKGEHKSHSKIDVRDGLFEVDFDTRICSPLYWNCEKIPKTPRTVSYRSARVKRGLWFRTDNWQPLLEEESEAIEEIFVKSIIHNLRFPLPESKKFEVVKTLSINNRFYRFLKSGEVYLDTNATVHYFRKKFSMSDGILLSRGYCEESVVDTIPSEVSHIVIISHGVGQRIASITWDTLKMRETCAKLKEKFFPEYKGRVEFFPIEWRVILPLNEGTIDSVTLSECHPLRAYLNSTMLDIMYYTSSIQRMEIMRTFYGEVARLYNLFCEHNPQFIERGGKVSVIAHSLGAVVAFDVLTAATPMYSDLAYIRHLQKMNTECEDMNDLIAQHIKLVNIEQKLLGNSKPHSGGSKPLGYNSFPKVENLFCLGSPLGVYLALRGIHPKSSDPTTDLSRSSALPVGKDPMESDIDDNVSPLPTTPQIQQRSKTPKYRDESHLHNSKANFRLFNIFHPRDPVAYRLEPLIFKHYTNIQPAVIGNPRLLKDPDLPKSPPTSTIEDKFGFTDINFSNRLKSKPNGNANGSVPKSIVLALNTLGNYLKKNHAPGIDNILSDYEKPPENMKLMPLPSEPKLRTRIDFQLEAEELTVQNLFVHVFTSHANYWTNEALCLFLLSQILGEAPKFNNSQ